MITKTIIFDKETLLEAVEHFIAETNHLVGKEYTIAFLVTDQFRKSLIKEFGLVYFQTLKTLKYNGFANYSSYKDIGIELYQQAYDYYTYGTGTEDDMMNAFVFIAELYRTTKQ